MLGGEIILGSAELPQLAAAKQKTKIAKLLTFFIEKYPSKSLKI
jgi:hypothetical protein